MKKFTFSELTQANLKSIVKIQGDIVPNKWKEMMRPCNDEERAGLKRLTSYLLDYQLHVMNEATIWSRAIYPLMMMAEKDNIQAWSGVALHAQYPHFELEGIIDGVLGNNVLGDVEAPYLVVLEAKRGVDAPNPQYQLFGGMLAAAWLNWQQDGETPQEIFGCYTISDSWTFVRGIVEEFEAEQPVMAIELSREYYEKFEAETILQILKFIVAKYVDKSQ